MAPLNFLSFVKLSTTVSASTLCSILSSEESLNMSRSPSETSSISKQPPKFKTAKPIQEALQIDNRKQIYTSGNGQHVATELTVSTKHFLKAAFITESRKKSIE